MSRLDILFGAPKAQEHLLLQSKLKAASSQEVIIRRRELCGVFVCAGSFSRFATPTARRPNRETSVVDTAEPGRVVVVVNQLLLSKCGKQ